MHENILLLIYFVMQCWFDALSIVLNKILRMWLMRLGILPFLQSDGVNVLGLEKK